VSAAAGGALVVVDVQVGFADPRWGPRDNPSSEQNIAALVNAWRERGLPIVFVRHDSTEPDSPLAPDRPGNALRPELGGPPDLLVTKRVNSAFHGDPSLDEWLRSRDIGSLVVCGITTNHCCETTARVAGNLGYDTFFAIDATHTFDRTGPDGTSIPAAEIARVTAANLHGEFATVVRTEELVRQAGGAASVKPA